MLSINTAVNALAIAQAEFGVTAAKLALLENARVALATFSSITEIEVPVIGGQGENYLGGTLIAGDYTYVVTALGVADGANVETPASAPVTITLDNLGTATVNGTAPAGATLIALFRQVDTEFHFVSSAAPNEFGVFNLSDDGDPAPNAAIQPPSLNATAPSAEALALAKTALKHTLYAIDCAHNDMSGSGPGVKTSQTEEKLNEPFHTRTALESAFAALDATTR